MSEQRPSGPSNSEAKLGESSKRAHELNAELHNWYLLGGSPAYCRHLQAVINRAVNSDADDTDKANWYAVSLPFWRSPTDINAHYEAHLRPAIAAMDEAQVMAEVDQAVGLYVDAQHHPDTLVHEVELIKTRLARLVSDTNLPVEPSIIIGGLYEGLRAQDFVGIPLETRR